MNEKKIAICPLCQERIDITPKADGTPRHRLMFHRRDKHRGKRGPIQYRIVREVALQD